MGSAGEFKSEALLGIHIHTESALGDKLVSLLFRTGGASLSIVGETWRQVYLNHKGLPLASHLSLPS